MGNAKKSLVFTCSASAIFGWILSGNRSGITVNLHSTSYLIWQHSNVRLRHTIFLGHRDNRYSRDAGPCTHREDSSVLHVWHDS